MKWKHFPRYWPFVRGIHRSPVNSPHKGQWRGALMFSLICVWINGWVNNREAGDLRRQCAHYDVIVMKTDSGDAIILSKYSVGSFPISPLKAMVIHDDVIKWESFSASLAFVRGIHRCPVNSPYKRALMFSLIGTWTRSWAMEMQVIWDAIAFIMTSL